MHLLTHSLKVCILIQLEYILVLEYIGIVNIHYFKAL